MAVILGLCAAVTYGAADFLGGLMTRRNKVMLVVFLSQLAGSALLFVAAPFFIGSAPSRGALVWGGMAGLAGAGGISFFYVALSVGRMSVIAPITAVEAASVPVLYGFLRGERPSLVGTIGVMLALVAVALISAAPDNGAPVEEVRVRSGWRQPGLVFGFISGFFFGVFFIMLAAAGESAGLWPLVAGRVSSLLVVGLVVAFAVRSLAVERGTGAGIAAAGILDVAANLFFLLASHRGLLSIVAVLTSMYPASTVVLARLVLHEHLFGTQLLGLVLAVAGIALIATG
ncbi:MAG: EamA family transporter [Actinomycetota bacterium]